ncbi:MAG: DNA-3-methyladenine glycosylase I [Gammaproteobacteria bacterium]|nr:DNA-3-methyladenine glycosylase I [Gammaproteobacteria bacterium]
MPKQPAGLEVCSDGAARCLWCTKQDDYQVYHDTEWGRPVIDDERLFEKICLEGFQAGLSWLTILRKRDNFRAGFANFHIETVAQFDSTDVERLLGDAGIVRHRVKIESTINNAQRALELIDKHGSLADFFWSFEPPKSERPRRVTFATVGKLATTDSSTRLSKTLKKQGWSFVGPTTMYAFMQAMGLVNDHYEGCATREIGLAERRALAYPIPA